MYPTIAMGAKITGPTGLAGIVYYRAGLPVDQYVNDKLNIDFFLPW